MRTASTTQQASAPGPKPGGSRFIFAAKRSTRLRQPVTPPRSPLFCRTQSTMFRSQPTLSRTQFPKVRIPAANNSRIMEANLSYHLLSHEFSVGKSDHRLGPYKGASLCCGATTPKTIDNSQINRIEPLRIPGLSMIMGPIRETTFLSVVSRDTATPTILGSTWRRSASSLPEILNSASIASPFGVEKGRNQPQHRATV